MLLCKNCIFPHAVLIENFPFNLFTPNTHSAQYLLVIWRMVDLMPRCVVNCKVFCAVIGPMPNRSAISSVKTLRCLLSLTNVQRASISSWSNYTTVSCCYIWYLSLTVMAQHGKATGPQNLEAPRLMLRPRIRINRGRHFSSFPWLVSALNRGWRHDNFRWVPRMWSGHFGYVHMCVAHQPWARNCARKPSSRMLGAKWSALGVSWWTMSA